MVGMFVLLKVVSNILYKSITLLNDVLIIVTIFILVVSLCIVPIVACVVGAVPSCRLVKYKYY